MTPPPEKPAGPKRPTNASRLTRFGWAALVGYFPLLLWLLPARSGVAALALRVGLFHGIGALWSLLLLRQEGRLAAFSEITSRPWRGAISECGQGLLGFLIFAGVATLLLRLPAGTLPSWLPALLHPLDLAPFPADPRLPMQISGILRLALVMGGGMLEEWIFRCALWLRWAGGHPCTSQPSSWAKTISLQHLYKLFALSLYFALLHMPQGPGAVIQAFSGSLVLGGLLYWRRSFWLIATLHALYNWITLPHTT